VAAKDQVLEAAVIAPVHAEQISMKNLRALRLLIESASHAAACHVVPLVRLGMGVETVNRGAVSRVLVVILESTGVAAKDQVLEAAMFAPAARLASF
jgi:hypothetical protein